jgi:acetolactate synthase regulatory subunit
MCLRDACIVDHRRRFLYIQVVSEESLALLNSKLDKQVDVRYVHSTKSTAHSGALPTALDKN